MVFSKRERTTAIVRNAKRHHKAGTADSDTFIASYSLTERQPLSLGGILVFPYRIPSSTSSIFAQSRTSMDFLVQARNRG